VCGFECAGRFLFWMFVCRVAFLLLDGKMVGFGDDCSILLAFFLHGNEVDHALSSWQRDVLLWNERKGSCFGDFRHIKMILHN
jgi:hypothetical protein